MKIGMTKLEAAAADLTKLAVDAIVNPANDMLWIGGGVSARIHHEGGAAIEAEALAKAPAGKGSAVITGAGNLPSKYVIHAVISGQDLATDEKTIRSAVVAALEAADERKCLSLAFPLIDTTAYDVEMHDAARAAVEETISFLLAKKRGIEKIVFVEHEESQKGVYEGALRKAFTRRCRP